MRVATAILTFSLVLVGGCAWSPSRDNPVDPASPYYQPPPTQNRPPVIDTLSVITDCVDDRLSYTCAFEARCQVTDLDNNLLYDSVMARLDTLELGPMSFDPQHGYFYLRRSQSDFVYGDLSVFQDRPFYVTVHDDSGATSTRFQLFPAVRLDWPVPDHPTGDATYPDTVFSYVAAVGWWPWGAFNGRHTYSIALYWNESTLVWDTSGISAADTSAIIGDSLLPSFVIRNPYKWYLTVIDELGNRMTAEPQYFVAYPVGEPPVRAPKPKADEVE